MPRLSSPAALDRKRNRLLFIFLPFASRGKESQQTILDKTVLMRIVENGGRNAAQTKKITKKDPKIKNGQELFSG